MTPNTNHPIRSSICLELPLPLDVYDAETGAFDTRAVMEHAHSAAARIALIQAIVSGDYAVGEPFIDD